MNWRNATGDVTPKLVADRWTLLAKGLLNADKALPEAEQVGDSLFGVFDNEFAPIASLLDEATQDAMGTAGTCREESRSECRIGICDEWDQALESHHLGIGEKSEKALAEPRQSLLDPDM